MICGIVDLGSNTIRLSIYKYEDGVMKLLLSKKSVAGLLGYVDRGALSPKGIAKACSVLANFKDILSNFGIDNIHVFATASLRNISNTDEVLRAIRDASGFAVEILSGEEEATLDFYGAVHATDVTDGLLVDIGGGSTELVSFEHRVVSGAVSMPVGSLNLSLRHVTSIIPDEDAFKKIRQDVQDELKKLKSTLGSQKTICGVGGTVRAARKVYNDMYGKSGDNMEMETDKFVKILSAYKKDSRSVMQRVMQLAPDRIHTVITGMLVLATVAKEFKAEKIVVSTYGVREGYFYHKILGGETA
ncbi:exopolyphosphatase / guanosine-5'-triphosphate,3'-diphosphate pyrophosphatase [Sporobacter termitidis DSM 10068]|uniref:Exopolyphosphatase / guanosine-5'-triphosphate,3'-diphosphate pyrophosphatase n=1 Tax=Sporobacter termitidis DSM 10068 TaxID=1123282 RepID=A0A1M5Z9Z7_9FIRM|nr:phosphatase [Sporobacter termitidis]SHI21040.1 exopolyphosphatase / guanosine-5'-triphosphate,3'-diphosphate pyrophosphatase [Sporobacter termitidis DSM 10068]